MKRTLMVALVVVALMFGAVAYAVAANTGTTGAEVKGAVGGLLTITPVTALADFGTVYPGDTGSAPISFKVRSNHEYTVSKDAGSGDDLASLLGMTCDNLAIGAAWDKNAGAERTHTDTYSYNIPYSTDVAPYSHTYTYTATQNP